MKITLMKCLRVGLAAAGVLALSGCRNEDLDSRLLDIALRQEKQEREIGRIARKVEGIERTINEIHSLAQKGSSGSGEGAPAVDFRSTAEYEKMAAAISAIQQQSNITRSEVAQTKEALEKQPELPMHGLPMVSTLGNRGELSDKLDSIVQKFAETVGDPSLRQSLTADVEQLKVELSDERPAGESYQQLVADLTQKVESEKNEELREWGETCLKALESASEDNLARRFQEATDFQNALRLRDLVNSHNIPQDVLRDLGLDTLDLTRTNDAGTGGETMRIPAIGISPQGRPSLRGAYSFRPARPTEANQ